VKDVQDTSDLQVTPHVLVGLEYLEPLAGHTQDGLFVFSSPGQDLVHPANVTTALYNQPAGAFNHYALNSHGLVAYTTPHAIFTITPLLYNSSPTLTPTLITDTTHFCQLGQVELTDNGTVIFEGSLSGGPTCSGAGFDGIFLKGPTPGIPAGTVIARGDSRLRDHQNFDGIVLGHRDQSGAIPFTTYRTDPPNGVPKVMVWLARFDG
jgi:hypothetical protein